MGHIYVTLRCAGIGSGSVGRSAVVLAQDCLKPLLLKGLDQILHQILFCGVVAWGLLSVVHILAEAGRCLLAA